MRIQNKFALLVVMPLVIFFWVFGWSLYWIGSNKIEAKPKKGESSEETVFTLLMPEQEYFQ